MLIEDNRFKSKKDLGKIENKDMSINRIYGIYIDDFRKFKNEELDLGTNMTIVFGRNGTLKSTIMGLIAQPFRTNHKSIFGNAMETKFSDVFKLSKTKDTRSYKYWIFMNIDDDDYLVEPIPLYPEMKPGTDEIARFRLVPSGRNAGDGYFSLPSVYTKLNRVYPLIDTTFSNQSKNPEYTKNEKKDIGHFYEKVLLRNDFLYNEAFDASEGKLTKHSFGPTNSYYDKETISSGEDNLGTFINTMISFQRIYNSFDKKPNLTGIWAIDEFEVSLHPIAQVNFMNYLLEWSEKYRVQIVLNTHSLYLIQNALIKLHDIKSGKLVINSISSRYTSDNELKIIKNPTYKDAYSELTLKDLPDNKLSQKIHITIFCEDKMAKTYLSVILNKKNFMHYIDWQFEVNPENSSGTSYTLLDKLCINYPAVIDEVNGIVISDADVKRDKKDKFKRHYIIPSKYNYPIEKEIVYWILSLDGADQFFKDMSKPKEMFKQSFTEKAIPLSIDEASNTKTGVYKNWVKSLPLRYFKRILLRYVKREEDIINPFRENIYSDIKTILEENGIYIQ